MNKRGTINLLTLGMSVTLATLSGCTDLVVQDKDSIIVKSDGSIPKIDVVESLKAAYIDLGAYTDQANIYSLGQHTTAEMIPPTRGVDWGDNGVWRTLDQHTWDATHSWVLGAWNQLNQRVYKCTQIIAANPAAQPMAEAKFLRAWNMFHVMDYWGQVPFREVTEGVNDNPKVKTRAEAFAFIVKDLTEALPGLPEAVPANRENSFASKAAANFLLAKLYLNKAVYTAASAEGTFTHAKADMDQVAKYVDAITAAGFKLNSDYYGTYTATGKNEIIFTSPEGTAQNRWYMTLHYDQNPSGWNGFATLADFYDKFEANDVRKGVPAKKDGTNYSGISRGFLIGQQYDDKGAPITDSRSKKPLVFTRDITLAGTPTDKGIRVIKYHPADAGKYILMRYADAYLMKAEATLRGGDAAGALAQVNALRTLRKATALAALTDDVMFDEIGRETYWEGGKRTVEVRFNKYLTGTGVDRKDPGTVLFPIPSDAITSNPNLKQNNGY
ncbi:RagB/SusD family nutrient uptake outer membrane protein [Fibrella aquatilis]|uniref:RagB/SusD family nutrient uptake outer membrane protein n=1 Tax=Fibrella aquatilis TaxID=2817059 RepID=A0A939JZN2_9BACT|nr:RagB/SusD family nutrient uptake outer membrane protein [Fibrella aquatilis]MBO0931121.1 RagB/SusD family nutrient uptake outer membrane protein [Fibrella aquatilis]